jgi:LysM repeat protein
MTERGLPSTDGSPACPFVAFDDDRDERSDRPDHRHRCFAEDPPAPRAHAHQEAYCLSSAFPVCPVFQDWARRESARTRPGADGAAAGGGAGAGAAAIAATSDTGAPDGEPRTDSDAPDADEWSGTSTSDVPLEQTPRRNPPRDWAAPPPWATSPGGSAGRPGDRPVEPTFDTRRTRPPEGAGLAGSAADRLASGGSFSDPEPTSARPPTSGASSRRYADSPSSGPDAELAGLVSGAAIGGAAAATDADARLAAERAATRAAEEAEYERVTGSGYATPSRTGARPTVSSTRSHAAPKPKPPQREKVQHDGPSWEQAKRYESYPQIRSRAGMPALPRLAVLAGAIGIAAIALFFLPALLGIGGPDDPDASPSPSVVEVSPTPEPTPEPDPTPQVYVIKEGDTLSAIANEFGLSLDDLLDANKDTITNPNRISVGDEIIIPTPPPDEVEAPASEDPEAEPTEE